MPTKTQKLQIRCEKASLVTRPFSLLEVGRSLKTSLYHSSETPPENGHTFPLI